MADAEFRYSDLLPTGQDDTPYRLITTEGVSTFEANGRTFLRQVSWTRVLGLTHAAQYPVGDREQQRPQLLELLGRVTPALP